MNIGVITLFPEMFHALNYGIVRRAKEHGIIALEFWNPRDFTKDKHKTVDDRPYGGGPGMLMKVEPLRDAIHAARKSKQQSYTIYLSPRGQRLNQKILTSLSQKQQLILVAGRYEGIDERLIDSEIDEELSIGDYVLTGGELAAMVLIDGITRLLPGALGDEASAVQESFINGLLDYPHYTRPEVIANLKVPSVLLSGDHQAIAKWRLKQALGTTWLKRPDLLVERTLTAEETLLLEEFKREMNLSNNS